MRHVKWVAMLFITFFFFGNGPSLSLAPFYNELLSQYNVAIVVAIGTCVCVCVCVGVCLCPWQFNKIFNCLLDGVASVPQGRK